MNIASTHCPSCDRPIEADAPSGICPKCLMGAAVSDPGSGRQETLPRKGVFNAPSPEALSDVIDSIEVIELLGHGGMGAVYRARQINLDRPVALKIIAPRLSDDPGFAERFVREAKTLARLNHPNIVTVYDFGRAGEYCYLIMELIEGINLRDAIVSGGITAEQALTIIPRICEALQYAHDHGVVHRDIKPENILVGLNDQVKIADFGLAKLLDHADANFTLTATQQVLGTRNYMAPEQIEKPATVDHRADIYSLGVVFYELLTGELPLGRFSLPSEKSNVTGEMDEVVLRALEKEPSRRFQQASEVKTAMESIDLEKESPLEPINGIPSVRRPPESRKPPVIAAKAAAVAGSEGSTPPVRRLSIPFKNDQVHGGLSQLHGIAHLNETTLEIEYRVHKLGVAKSAKKIVSIPYSKIVNTLLTRGMFSSSLEIQSGSLETFDDIPGSIQGRLKMTLDKAHEQISDEFRNALEARIAAASPEGRAEHAAASASSLGHVPFTISEVHGGFSEAAGIAKITNEHLVIEYEIKDAFGVVKSAPRISLVPVSDVIALKFRKGIFNDSTEVQTNGIDNVASIPNSTQGKFKILTKKRDRNLTKTWLRQVHRITGLSLPEELCEVKSSLLQHRVVELRERLKPFRLALAVMVFLNMFCFGILVAILVLGNGAAIDTIVKSFQQLASVPEPHANRFELILIMMIGPILMTAAGATLWWLLRGMKAFYLVFVLLIIIAIPIHPGVVIGFPLAIWLLAILLKPTNISTYLNHQENQPQQNLAAELRGR